MASSASDLAPSLLLRVGRSNSITHSPRQSGAQATPVAARALDHPRPFGLAAVGVDEIDGVVIAVAGRREAALGNDAGAGGVEHSESDPVSVGVDADHVMDEFCKHERWNLRVSGSVGAGLGGTATPGL